MTNEVHYTQSVAIKQPKKLCLLHVWGFEVFLRLESLEVNPCNIILKYTTTHSSYREM